MATIKKTIKLKPVNAINIKTASNISMLLNQARDLLIKRLVELETKKYLSKTIKEKTNLQKSILITKNQLKKIN